MTTLKLTQTTAMALLLAMALTLTGQRVAQAGDLGKVAAAVAAGVIVYEILDDDDDGRRYRRAPRYRRTPPRPATVRGNFMPTPFPRYDRYYGEGYYYDDDRCDDRYDRYDRYDYGPPYRHGHYKQPKKGKVKVDVHRGRRGTSVDIRYRGR